MARDKRETRPLSPAELARVVSELLRHDDPAVARATRIAIERVARPQDPRKAVADILNRHGEFVGAGVDAQTLIQRTRERIEALGHPTTAIDDRMVVAAIHASVPKVSGRPKMRANASGTRRVAVHAIFRALRIASGGERGTEKFLERHAPIDHDAPARLAAGFARRPRRRPPDHEE